MHAALHSSPAAYALTRYSDTTAEFQANLRPESAAPPHSPSSSPPGPAKPKPPPAAHPSVDSSPAPDSPPLGASCPTHTRNERYPGLHCCQSTSVHRSETRPWSHRHKTSRTPPTESPAQFPQRATAAATPPP